MRVGHAVVFLLLLTAGCTRGKPAPPVSEPQVASQPTPQPAARPAAGATPSTRTCCGRACTTCNNQGAAAATKVSPHVVQAPAAAPVLDLNALEEAAQGNQGHRLLHQDRAQKPGRRSAGPVPRVLPGQGEDHHDGAAPVLRPADDEGAVAAAGRGPEARVRHRVLARGDMGSARGPEEIRDP